MAGFVFGGGVCDGLEGRALMSGRASPTSVAYRECARWIRHGGDRRGNDSTPEPPRHVNMARMSTWRCQRCQVTVERGHRHTCPPEPPSGDGSDRTNDDPAVARAAERAKHPLGACCVAGRCDGPGCSCECHPRSAEDPLCSCESPTDPGDACRCRNCALPTRRARSAEAISPTRCIHCKEDDPTPGGMCGAGGRHDADDFAAVLREGDRVYVSGRPATVLRSSEAREQDVGMRDAAKLAYAAYEREVPLPGRAPWDALSREVQRAWLAVVTVVYDAHPSLRRPTATRDFASIHLALGSVHVVAQVHGDELRVRQLPDGVWHTTAIPRRESDPAKPEATCKPHGFVGLPGHCFRCGEVDRQGIEMRELRAERDELRVLLDNARDVVSVRARERDAAMAEVERLKRALGEVGAHADRCEECDCGEAKIATQTTTHPISGIPIFLCEEHAEETRAQYRKATSKGCGPQPEVEPHEQSPEVEIALRALGEWPSDSSGDAAAHDAKETKR